MYEVVSLHRIGASDRMSVGPDPEVTVSCESVRTYLKARRSWEACFPWEVPDGGRQFLLTVDDGFRQTAMVLTELLEEIGGKALLFVTTGFVVGSDYPYEFELSSVIEDRHELVIRSGERSAPLRDREDCRNLYESFRRQLKSASIRRREKVLDDLASMNGYDRSRYRNEEFLTPEEISTLDRHPRIHIGAHSHRHPLLTRSLPWTTLHELSTSKRWLENELEREVTALSYPYGGQNLPVRLMANWIGYEFGFTTESRRVDSIWEGGALALPRLDLANVTREESMEDGPEGTG